MNPYFIYFLVVIIGGICIAVFLATRRKYRDASAAWNYEKIRNKLTVREPPKPKVKEQDYSGGLILGKLMGTIVTILVGFFMIGVVNDALQDICHPDVNSASYNRTSIPTEVCNEGFNKTMFNLVPMFFAIGVLGVAFMTLRDTFKTSGLL